MMAILRSAMRGTLRAAVRLLPGPTRSILALSAQGYLPSRIYGNRVAQELAPRLFTEGMPLYRGPYRLHVPLDLVPEYLSFEPMTVECFRKSLCAGMTVIDVGANAGYYTLEAARAVGNQGIVHAIEPCDANLALLERNIHSSGLHNIHVHACAAGAERSQRTFHITDSSFDHGFYSHPIGNAVRGIIVQQIPLDELTDGPVDVIKIDVEGAEIDVLNGMTRIVRDNRRLSLFVEWSPLCMKEAGRAAHELPDRLQDLGFHDLSVLDDRANQERSVVDVLEMLRSQSDDDVWYGMICARSAR
jgi:FkbM family methyltransferase